MIILWQKDITWEKDFILNNIFGKNVKVIEFDSANLPEIDSKKKYCIVFNQWFRDVEFLKKLTPRVMFFMSEEKGDRSYITSFADYTQLFLHCYNHNYEYKKNSLQMPLGYVSGFYKGQKIKSMNKRRYAIGFIGDGEKSDRPEMLNVFRNSTLSKLLFVDKNDWKINEQKVKPRKVFTAYNNSIFVPIGRGNYSLDCFRVYEAIVAGAIPIVVGEENEITRTFNYDGHIPPLLFCSSWEEALKHCEKLLKTPAKLQKMQDNLLKWWKSTIERIKGKVKKVS